MNNVSIEALANCSKIHEIVIMTDDTKRAIHTISEMIETTDIAFRADKRPPPDSICITGLPGVGKTTLTKILLQKYPNDVIEHNNTKIHRCRILKTIATGVSIKSLAVTMLNQISTLDAPNSSQAVLTDRLAVQLISSKTNLIIVDEFHELINDKNGLHVMRWLKSLINLTSIPILVLGTPGVESLIDSNDEIARRFKKITLNSLRYDIEMLNCEFKSYVNALADQYKSSIGFSNFYEFNDRSDYLRLFLATNGHRSNIAELYKEAAKEAIRDGCNFTKASHFIDAFESAKMYGLEVGSLNPFLLGLEDVQKLYFKQLKRVA